MAPKNPSAAQKGDKKPKVTKIILKEEAAPIDDPAPAHVKDKQTDIIQPADDEKNEKNEKELLNENLPKCVLGLPIAGFRRLAKKAGVLKMSDIAPVMVRRELYSFLYHMMNTSFENTVLEGIKELNSNIVVDMFKRYGYLIDMEKFAAELHDTTSSDEDDSAHPVENVTKADDENDKEKPHAFSATTLIKIIHDICKDILGRDLKVSKVVKLALLSTVEQYVIDVFKFSLAAASHANRMTVMRSDVELLYNLHKHFFHKE